MLGCFLSNGLSFGEPNFGDTYGENHMVAMKGILKVTKTAKYRFFVRSDDSDRLFLNTAGAALPDAKTATPIAFETGCCNGFQEPPNDRTSDLISLTAGQSYGVLFLVKEGGGGDWGQVAWRAEDDTTPAGSLKQIKDNIYWYGPAPVAAAPALSVARNADGTLTVTFEGSLETAPAVTGPWTKSAATSPAKVTPDQAGAYARARR